LLLIKVYSRSSYIKSPKNILWKKCSVNVENTDNKCFLYSIISILKYDDIENHDFVLEYDKYLNNFSYKEEWFPMTLSNISKFEAKNPGLSINVLKWNDIPKERTIHFKHPSVEIIRRSKVDAPEIYLLLLEDGKKLYY